MHMKLQILKQNTIRFVVTHFLHIALIIIAFMVVKYFEPIGIAQVYPTHQREGRGCSNQKFR